MQQGEIRQRQRSHGFDILHSSGWGFIQINTTALLCLENILFVCLGSSLTLLRERNGKENVQEFTSAIQKDRTSKPPTQPSVKSNFPHSRNAWMHHCSIDSHCPHFTQESTRHWWIRNIAKLILVNGKSPRSIISAGSERCSLPSGGRGQSTQWVTNQVLPN